MKKNRKKIDIREEYYVSVLRNFYKIWKFIYYIYMRVRVCVYVTSGSSLQLMRIGSPSELSDQRECLSGE